MKRKNYNENYFENIDSNDKAYFLGLISADGCVINNTKIYRYQLTLKLHIKDIDILEKFLQSIDGEMSLWKHTERDMIEIHLSGKKIVKDLENLGVTPNKTFHVNYPVIDENFDRHFLRGYFDGDGCIRINKDKRDNSERGDLRIVSGSIKMLEKINRKMNHHFGVTINKLYGPKNKNFKYIGWSGMKDIEKIYNGFYLDTDLFLIRKKHIFDSVIEIINKKLKYRKK